MAQAEKKFKDLKDRYVSNYKRTNGKNSNVSVRYENGFVIIDSKTSSSSGIGKHRISEFEKMTLTLEGRPDYAEPKKAVKIILQQHIKSTDVDTEDNGEAKITDVSVYADKKRNEDDGGIFVRLISNCPDKDHTDFNSLVGRKVKITIETID